MPIVHWLILGFLEGGISFRRRAAEDQTTFATTPDPGMHDAVMSTMQQ